MMGLVDETGRNRNFVKSHEIFSTYKYEMLKSYKPAFMFLYYVTYKY